MTIMFSQPSIQNHGLNTINALALETSHIKTSNPQTSTLDTINTGARHIQLTDCRESPSVNYLTYCKPQHFEVSSPDNDYMVKSMTEEFDKIQTQVSQILIEHNMPLCIQESIKKETMDFINNDDLFADLLQKITNIMNTSATPKTTENVKSIFKNYMQDLNNRAQTQHQSLIELLNQLNIDASSLLSIPGKSDAVFATDNGVQIGNTYFPSNFKNERRKGEELPSIQSAKNKGLNIKILRDHQGNKLGFEGGDIRQIPGKFAYLMGSGFRSDQQAATRLAEESGAHVIPLQLLRSDFYHLDCCVAPLPGDKLMIYPGSPDNPTLSNESFDVLMNLYGQENCIFITEAEAASFATNFVCVDKTIIVNTDSLSSITKQKLAEYDLKVQEINYETFHLSGGSIRCSLNELNSHFFKARLFFDDQQLFDLRQAE